MYVYIHIKFYKFGEKLCKIQFFKCLCLVFFIEERLSVLYIANAKSYFSCIK